MRSEPEHALRSDAAASELDSKSNWKPALSKRRQTKTQQNRPTVCTHTVQPGSVDSVGCSRADSSHAVPKKKRTSF